MRKLAYAVAIAATSFVATAAQAQIYSSFIPGSAFTLTGGSVLANGNVQFGASGGSATYVLGSLAAGSPFNAASFSMSSSGTGTSSISYGGTTGVTSAAGLYNPAASGAETISVTASANALFFGVQFASTVAPVGAPLPALAGIPAVAALSGLALFARRRRQAQPAA